MILLKSGKSIETLGQKQKQKIKTFWKKKIAIFMIFAPSRRVKGYSKLLLCEEPKWSRITRPDTQPIHSRLQVPISRQAKFHVHSFNQPPTASPNQRLKSSSNGGCRREEKSRKHWSLFSHCKFFYLFKSNCMYWLHWKSENKAGYTAISCRRVGRGRGAFSHFLTWSLRTKVQTDKASYRVACPQLKIELSQKS